MWLLVALATVVYAAFGLLDVWAMPRSVKTAWFIRYGCVCPVLCLVVAILRFSKTGRGVQTAISLGGIAAGTGISCMIATARPDEFAYGSYYVGLILMQMVICALVKLRFNNAVVVSAVLLVTYEYVAIFHQHLLETTDGAKELLMSTFFLIAANVIGLLTSWSLESYARKDYRQRLAIELEKDKSEELLHNILPQEIASRLKDERKVIADEFGAVSILFADIVGFTPLSARLSPAELVALLNDLFAHFDKLVEKYGLEKIKTIGDCYMVAAGVPRPHPDHAVSIVAMALEMIEHVRTRSADHADSLDVRIGLNTGPVVAGVIGTRKFIYDLWGDTVNVASRMESQGCAGRIQIPRTTYELVKEHFTCESRGTITVKGKGPMEVWHVLNHRGRSATETNAASLISGVATGTGSEFAINPTAVSGG